MKLRWRWGSLPAAVALLVWLAGCFPHDERAGHGEVNRLIFRACTGGKGAWQSLDFIQWSADGSSVFVTRSADIFAAAADGSRLRQIVDEMAGLPGVGPMSAFSMSPDGGRLVYSTCRYPPTRLQHVARPLDREDYQYEIAIAKIDGTDPERLTFDDSYSNFPMWSPDGTRIAFLSGRHVRESNRYRASSSAHLYTMAPDGSEVRDLTLGLHAIVNHPPQWAPDGRRLAFVGRDAEGKRAIYIMGADGTDLKRIPAAVSGPSWSPDGERLAFARPDGAEVALVTVAADGSDAQRVTTIDGWHPPHGEPDPAHAWIETVAWSPAGEQILYTCGRVVCVVDLDGTPVGRSPIDPTGQTSRPVAAWSPDGARIAITGTRLLREDIVLYSMAPDGTDLRILVRHDAAAGLQSVGASRPAGPVDLAGCAAGTTVPDPAANPGLVQDCATLLAIRDVLGGGSELNWTADRPITEWEGVELGGAPPRVSSMQLAGHGLSGVIPPELAGLTQLRALDLRANWLGGEIPPELGRLAELQALSLDGNYLSGRIPPELGGLTQLSVLRLYGNYLQDGIPPELGELANLKLLDLAANQLTGAIPAELGQLAKLEFLSLAANQLMGPTPAELGQLANLGYLSLYPNPLTRCIAPALQKMPHNRPVRLLQLPDCE